MGLSCKFNELVNVKSPWDSVWHIVSVSQYYYFVIYLKGDGKPLVLCCPMESMINPSPQICLDIEFDDITHAPTKRVGKVYYPDSEAY